MECVTQTVAKIQDKVQTVLQCKINTNQMTEHGGEEREVAVGHRRLAVAEKLKKTEMLLSWQKTKRDEEELDLQILRALSILRFLEVFLMVFLKVFMVFLLAPPSVLALGLSFYCCFWCLFCGVEE
jgi:hypothetical protein